MSDSSPASTEPATMVANSLAFAPGDSVCSGHSISKQNRRSSTRNMNSFTPSISTCNKTPFSGSHGHSVLNSI
ncbi:hypothetical protein MtrunA17_Chr8g0370011 [Medicago truncatula]|uniref:Uncharacterized protein n=1 Tax=Medicago truncatula TaxID=3880 RepID=A0A396GL02_MEDTR|nr:hypothetical protein MtrunA17_Chr8g0370011 [Medicago truncatula]